MSDSNLRLERRLVPLAAGLLAFVQWFPAFSMPHATGFGDWQMIHHNWEAAYAALARYGEWPLWDPFHCGGISILRNPESQVYSPFFVLAFLVGTVLATKVMLWAHAAFGLWGMFKLAREVYRLDVVPGAIASFTWVCSGVIAWDGAGGHATFLPFLFAPWLVLLVRQPLPVLKTAAMLALLLVVTLYEGGTYPLPFFAILLLLEFVLRALRTRALLATLKLAATTAVLAVTAGMIRIMPSVLALREFPRQMPNDDAVGPAELLVMLTAREHSWDVAGHPFAWAEYGSYVGWPIVAFATAGTLLTLWRGPRHLVAGLVLFGALTLGNHGAWSPWSLLHALPIYDALRVPTRFAVLFTFYLALLAAYALHVILRCTSWRQTAVVAATFLAVAQLGDLLYVTRPIIDRWREPPLENAAPAERLHLVQEDYYRRYASYPRLNLGTPQCYVGAMNWKVSEALWIGDIPQARLQDVTGRIHEIERTTASWRVDVELASAGRLVFNQNHAEGWRADVGTVVADRDRLALDLPQGHHVVQLTYRPPEFLPSLAISLGGLVVIGFFCLRRFA